MAAALTFKLIENEVRGEECIVLASENVLDDLSAVPFVRGLMALGRDAAAVDAARQMVHDGLRTAEAALSLAAAGLVEEAAHYARLALENPRTDLGPWQVLYEPIEMAALLPIPERSLKLQRLGDDGATISPHVHAERLARIAAALHEYEPGEAGRTLRDAFLTSWVSGRGSFMGLFELDRARVPCVVTR
jgi:hypothetical protein